MRQRPVQPPFLEPFSVPDLVNSTVMLHQRAADVKGVQLTVSCDAHGELPRIALGDSKRIGQILSNFISNGYYPETNFGMPSRLFTPRTVDFEGRSGYPNFRSWLPVTLHSS